MVAQEFLLQECKNLRALLEKSLRYEYGPVGSKDFYDECLTRLQLIEQEIAAKTDAFLLGIESVNLNQLAKLICRLERSSVGEYSWPFVNELKAIASAICTENTTAGNNTPNLIYVLADGGLDAYQIFCEQRRPAFTQRRLLTIVFPKSLKQFVLLHSILGHELGHAIWRCSDHQNEIKRTVDIHLREGTFASEDATAKHLFDAVAPQMTKVFLQIHKVNPAAVFNSFAKWDAWLEEILCDLIGLVIFGPSFAAAECEMLWSLNFGGAAFGPEHPVASWRVNCILKGMEILGHDKKPPAGHFLESYHDKFWAYLETFRGTDSWHNALSDDQIRRALKGLQDLAGRFPPTTHPDDDLDLLADLVKKLVAKIPPVGYSLQADGTPELKRVDFRHILRAGWYVKCSHPEIPVHIINQLCEHAIMQQRAIDIMRV